MKYIFRGHVVLEYNPEKKQVKTPRIEGLNGFDFCRFIPEDYELMAKFFETAAQHAKGKLHESFLKDVVVN